MGLTVQRVAVQLGGKKTENEEFAANPSFRNTVGIKTLHRCLPQENTQTLACAALRGLLAAPSPPPDFLAVVTQTAPSRIPHMASFLQRECLSQTSLGSLDFNMACPGFVYAYIVLCGMQQAGMLRRCVLVCADSCGTLSSRAENGGIPLFSDAAVAVALEESDGTRLLAWDWGTDGRGAEKLWTPPVEEPALEMDGNLVLLFTMREVPNSVHRTLQRAQVGIDDVDWFVFHQPSSFFLRQLRHKLKIPENKMPTNIKDVGNTGSCAIPLLLADMLERDDIQRGDKILFSSFGAGLSWASCLVQV